MSEKINSPVCIVDGRIVRRANHTPPSAHVIAFCPHCLTYGSTMGLHDRVCGNCGKDECRMYKEITEND